MPQKSLTKKYAASSFALLLGALLALPASAIAQQSATTDSVVVRSSSGQKNQFEAMSSTEVITQEDLERKPATNLGAVLQELSGLDSASFGAGVGRPVIRGLSDYRVGVMRDFLPSGDVFATGGDHATIDNPLDLTRVEVLKGASALRYGPYATSGVVNLLNLPQGDETRGLTGGYKFSYGTNAKKHSNSAFAQYAESDMVTRVSAYFNDSENYKIPDYAETALQRASEEEEHEEGDEEEEEEHHVAHDKGKVSNSDVKELGASLTHRWQGKDWVLRSAVNYNEMLYGAVGHGHGGRTVLDMERLRFALDGKYVSPSKWLQHSTANFAYTDYGHKEVSGGATALEFEQAALALRNDYALAPIGNWQAFMGWNYSSEELKTKGAHGYMPSVDTQRFGVFVNQVMQHPVWLGEFAVRVDWQEYDPKNTLEPETAKEAALYAKTYDRATASFALGTGYRLTRDMVFGGTVSYNQRAPAITELFSNGIHEAAQLFEEGDPTLRPESVLGVEAYWRWRNKNTRIMVSAYHNSFKDFIYKRFTGIMRNDEGEVQEAGEEHEEGEEEEHHDEDFFRAIQYAQRDARIYGLEIDALYYLPEFGAIAPYTEFALQYLRGDFRGDGGGAIPLMPPVQMRYGLGAEYKGVDVKMRLTHALKQDRLGAHERKTDSYTTFDIEAHWEINKNARLGLVAKNLTDEEVRLHQSVLKELVPEPGRDIQFVLSLKY